MLQYLCSIIQNFLDEMEGELDANVENLGEELSESEEVLGSDGFVPVAQFQAMQP